MGLMFAITGAILVIWGLKTNGDAIYAKSLESTPIYGGELSC